MIEINDYEDVTQIRPSPELDGKPLSRVTAAPSLHHQDRSVEEIVREIFGGEHLFAQMTNDQYPTGTLSPSALRINV